MSLYPEDIEMLWYELKGDIDTTLEHYKNYMPELSYHDAIIVHTLRDVLKRMEYLEERGAIFNDH